MAAQTQYIFSTGKVRIGPVGATLSDADHLIGAIQGANLDITFQKAEVMETPQQSMFPVAVGFHSGNCRLRLEVESVDRRIWTSVMNAVASNQGTANLYTIGKTTKPIFFKVELDGLDADGKQIKATLFKACTTGIPLNFRLTNFATMSLDCEGYPSSTDSSKVCDVLMGQ